MKPDLFGRALKLQIDTLVIDSPADSSGLHVTFKAVKTLKPDPNTCDVSVWNLNADHRAAITKATRPVVSLAAGYGTDLTQLFLGQTIHSEHNRRNADIVTTLSTSDGGEKKQKSRVNVSFGAHAQPADVLRAITKALGLKPGNTATAIAKLSKGLPANMYLEGTTLSGNAGRELDALCRSAGLEWSIQDGALQFLDLNTSLSKFAIVLSPSSGLVGSPSINSKGIVTGQALIVKDMLPGRQVRIESEFLNTRARLTKCTYSGDTHSGDWTVDFEADTKGAK